MSDVVEFNITRTIVCGKTTCASAPGKFCDYVGTRRFGSERVCIAFDGEPIRLYDRDGWLQRCETCLEAEKGNGNANSLNECVAEIARLKEELSGVTDYMGTTHLTNSERVKLQAAMNASMRQLLDALNEGDDK